MSDNKQQDAALADLIKAAYKDTAKPSLSFSQMVAVGRQKEEAKKKARAWILPTSLVGAFAACLVVLLLTIRYLSSMDEAWDLKSIQAAETGYSNTSEDLMAFDAITEDPSIDFLVGKYLEKQNLFDLKETL